MSQFLKYKSYFYKPNVMGFEFHDNHNAQIFEKSTNIKFIFTELA